MKKFISILCVITLFMSCAKLPLSDIPTIDDCIWVMNTVQDTADNGSVIACNEIVSESYPEAWKLDVILSAADGTLEIYDRTNNLRFNIKYELTKNDIEVRNYSLLGEESGGYAILGKRQFANEPEIDILIIAIDRYVLNFYKNESKKPLFRQTEGLI